MYRTIGKYIARTVMFPIITSFHLEKLLPLQSSTKRLILYYHGVTKYPDFSINGRHLPAEIFEKHLSYFKSNFRIIPLNKMFELVNQGIIPKYRTISISFDDGYENNFTTALPLLEKYSIPATVFTTTQGFTSNLPILPPDAVDILNRQNFIKCVKLGDNIFIKHNEFREKETGEPLGSFLRKQSVRNTKDFLEQLLYEYALKDILAQYNSDYWKLLTRNQLLNLSNSPLIEIGAHTVSHPDLKCLALDELLTELKQSKEDIEQLIRKQVNTIAFPYGSYGENVKKACKEVGFENLAAVKYANAIDKEDSQILPRFGISNTTTYESNIIQIQSAFKKFGF